MIRIKKISGFKLLFKLIKYTWCASPATFMLLIFTSLLMSALGFFEIITIEALFSSAALVAKGSGLELIYKPITALLVMLALYPVGEWMEYIVRGYFWRRGSGYMKSLHHKRIDHMQPIEFEDSRNIDELQKASLGSEDAPECLRVILQILFLYIPYILMLLLYLISIKPMLAFIIVLIFMPTLFLELIRMRQNFDFQDKIANAKRKTKYFEDCMVSREYFKETLLNGSFEYFNKQFAASNQEYSKEFIRVKKHMLKTSVRMKLLNSVGFLSVLALLVYYVYKGAISIGLFAAIYYSISKITSMLKRAIEDIGLALTGISNTSFLVRLLESDEVSGENEELNKSQDIHLNNVSFTYPNSNGPTLRNINLTIKVGESLAIVGENGSGKSTLTKVIMGLYEPTQGSVTYGHKSLNGYSSDTRFNKVSAVFQSFMRYKLSVEDNIRISSIDSKASVEEALSSADVNLKDLNANIDTILSREFGGHDLSGGQWQRIAIARGLYRPHDLIVLDEPTAAIDPIEEAKVFESFEKISLGKTCIFVTHRLGSVKIADRIVVLEKGEILEEGTHEELMEKKSSYYKLLKSQAQWYER